ncbi:PP2C family protein-serine/threonine phosphatase [Sporocytophaga myxococcoides]|uniref:PP2C family protein-serine/threonine phosphatase n=1 Tax=Sporocytophaga myxococcoides TaxID=153721 RepID=UPI001B7F9FC8|nr:SpoIIE family protein phosphatase [Sporocytophaga myxococcoides]
MRNIGLFIFLITLFLFQSAEGADKKSSSGKEVQDKRSIVIKAIESAELHAKSGKTKKAITELEKIIETAKTCGDESLLAKTYELLVEFNHKTGARKKEEEYTYWLNLIKTAAEKKQLEKQSRKDELEMSKLREQTLNAEWVKEQTEEELNRQTDSLRKTKDSLDLLDLKNKEHLAQIDLLKKEREIEDLKIKEQESRLKNQELVIKEKDARHRFITAIIASLILGIITLSILAYVIYKNLRQKRQYSDQIEKQLGVIKHQHDNITNSINYAQKIQNAMLPNESSYEHLFEDSFILFKPKDIVSGDFYWFFNVNDGDDRNEGGAENNKVIVVAADCTGHGVPGALMSMVGYNLLNMIVYNKIYEPHLILTELNKNVRSALQQDKNDNKDGMDMALCVINRKDKTIEFAGAKNPLIVIKNGELEHLKGDKHPIGGSQGQAHRDFTKHTVSYDGDTHIYLFSDGYEDQFGGPESKKFMVKNLKDLLLKIHREPFSKQKDILNKTIEAWKGTKEKQIDDILIMGMKVN